MCEALKALKFFKFSAHANTTLMHACSMLE